MNKYKEQAINYTAWIIQMCDTFGLKYDPEAPSHALELYFYKLHKHYMSDSKFNIHVTNN